MQIIFGEYTFEATEQPRENGSTITIFFDPEDTPFEEVKEILHEYENTVLITFVDGDHTIEYQDFTVYKELQFNDVEDYIIASARLNKEDVQARLRRIERNLVSQSEAIDSVNETIDDVMTIVIPELLGGMMEG